jgi:hypothetical protein
METGKLASLPVNIDISGKVESIDKSWFEKVAQRPQSNKMSTSSGVQDSVKEKKSVDIKKTMLQERSHEIIGLLGKQLVINWGNFNRWKNASNSSAATMVVSFLGDTNVGKSTTIAGLMSADEERPFVQKARQQTESSSSTTSNINLYPCLSLSDGMTINFLDFEGECGSEIPLMGLSAVKNSVSMNTTLKLLGSNGLGENSQPGQTSSKSGAGLVNFLPSNSPTERADNIRDLFPKLAYCISDVVCLIGQEPFFSTRYLERAISFAKRANTNVNDVELPVLLLVSNKRNADECELDIQTSTQLFISSMGNDLKTLDSYFSCIICVYLPNKKGVIKIEDENDENGKLLDGAQLYESQMMKLKLILSSLMKTKLAASKSNSMQVSRLITSKYGLWFQIIPKIVSLINANQVIHVTHLIDQVWLQSLSVIQQNETPFDIFKAIIMYARPTLALSMNANRIFEDVLLRFTTFCSFICDLSVYFIAARLRNLDPAVLIPTRVESFTRNNLEKIVYFLSDITPCRSIYGDANHLKREPSVSLGKPVDRSDEPVMCLQEQRVHAKSHRGSRRVAGGGATLWSKLFSFMPYNPVWPGDFESAVLNPPDINALVQDVLELVSENLSKEDFILHLGSIQSLYSSSIMKLDIVPFQQLKSSVTDQHSANWKVQIDLSQTFDGANMPYCIGCARKVRINQTNTTSSVSEPSTSNTELSLSPYDTSVEPNGSYSSWIGTVFNDMFAGSQTDKPTGSNSGSAKSPKKGALRQKGSSDSVSSNSITRQSVKFGMCTKCIHSVKEGSEK